MLAEEDKGVLSWVNRSRAIETAKLKDKKLAETRAQMFDEQDEETVRDIGTLLFIF